MAVNAQSEKSPGAPFTIADAMRRNTYGESSFGDSLQAIRKARGLSQPQLAEAAGTSQRAISDYDTEAGFPLAPAVIGLTKLPVTARSLRRNGAQGERHGR